MKPTIALIHTSPTMVPVFKSLTTELLPDADVYNMVDESLLRDIIREGKLVPATARRLVGHVTAAADAGASHILVTCSSIGRAVEASRILVGATVLRVDEPMTRVAVESGSRIGVIATLPSTLEPTASLVRQRATASSKQVDVVTRLVDGAFQAVITGDGATHDKLVGDALRALGKDVDVIVLAQASMARVVDALPPADRPVPILSSPRLAVEHLAGLLKGTVAAFDDVRSQSAQDSVACCASA